ncbi:MAG: uroporphyrinogen decarboxylase [Candidatus Verstraetearchaeota archaeon]|nr:uroporphyrinogen decarboxylase [Candidatus Verstraetearchaeota archaeon]
MVTSLERIVAALTMQEADRVPAGPLVCGAARRVYGITYDKAARNPELWARSLIQSQKMIGHDGFLLLVDLSVECAAWGQSVDYPIESTPITKALKGDPLIKTTEDYEKLEYVDARKANRMKDVIKIAEIVAKEKGKELGVMGFVYGPAGTLSMMRGLDKMSIDLKRNPSAVKKALKVINDVLLDYTVAQMEAGVHAIVLDVLFASKFIWSRSVYDEFEGQFCTKIADEVRKHNCVVILHNCGQATYFDTMIKWYKPTGISIHYLPDGVTSLQDLKEKWGKQTAILGLMDCPKTLYMGTEEDVIREAKAQIEALAPGGGFLLCSGCEFPPNASLLNARAMVEACKMFPYKKS